MNRVSVQVSRCSREPKKIRFMYTNYKMETEQRTCLVLSIWFGSSDFHQGEQWFMEGHCLDRDAVRNFAMRDMTNVTELHDERK